MVTHDIAAVEAFSEAAMTPELISELHAFFEAQGNAETLRRYWAEGEGAAKIRWGEAGDFMRCVKHLGKYVADPKGYCSDMHVRATDARPGHAPSEAATASDPQHPTIHETTTLTERATSSTNGRWPVQVISAGLGSSGYYSPQVLERAAVNQLVKGGTPLFFDHPSKSARTDRPERSVRDIAAVFTGPASYDKTREALMGEVQVFGPYRELVAEMAPHIGLSIDGSATDITEGEFEGRRVPVIEDLFAINSVDLVTKAGRGGQFLSLYESAREQMGHDLAEADDDLDQLFQRAIHAEPNAAEEGAMSDTPTETATTDTATETTETTTEAVAGTTTETPSSIQETHMTDTTQGAGGTTATTETTVPPRNPREVMEAQIREQGRQIALLRAENRARDIVAEVLGSGWIGDAQRARLTSSLVTNLPLTENGDLDEQGLRDRAQHGLDEAETEAAEILSAAGVGTPRGLGALTTPTTEAAGKQYEDELRESFRMAGLSDAAVNIAVKGR